MKDDKLYLLHIAERIGHIESYTQTGRDAFMQTRMIQDAVIRNFEVIGEATKRISEELKLAYPDFSWREIEGFRDMLIHDYIKVKLHIVWNVIERDFPILKDKVEGILRELEEET